MSNFPQPLGTLPTGGKRRVFNPSTLKRSGEEPSTEEDQYEEATTEEQRKVVYKRALAEYVRERAIDRMLII